MLGKNGHLKVLALTLTIVLHFFVLAEQETTRVLTLAVEVGSVPAGHVVLNELPDVQVTIRGSARGFAQLDEDELRRVVINVNDVQERRREIRQADLGLASHFDVEAVSPRWVDLVIDELVEREVPIRAVIRGTPARGYEATDPTVDPEFVIVSAPSSYFPDFDAVFTEGIDIQNLDHPLTQEVDLSIQRPYVTFADDPTVNVTINVETVIETRTLEGVALRVAGPQSDRCSVDVHSIAVTVSGPKTLVDALEPRSIFAT
ncbi:MAG: YbbR domain-containing protein, partial [Bradymonadia bacterium]